MSWHLNTRMLRMLIAVADSPTAAQAASELNITPSALSHQMKQAEASLRVKLFERRSGRAKLTRVGEQVLASARVIVAELDAAEGVLERSRRSEKPALRIGGGPYPVQRLVLPRLYLLPQPVPHLDFISRTETFPPVRALVEGELDVALVCSKITQRGLTVVPLFEDELVAVLPQGHRLSEQAHVEARDLSQETYVSYSRIVEHGLEDDLSFRPGRIAPARFIQADSVEAILDHVEAGLGFSILSRWAAQGGSRPMVALRSITEGGLRVAWSAVTQNPRQPAAEFVRHLANEMARGGPEPTASRGPAGPA